MSNTNGIDVIKKQGASVALQTEAGAKWQEVKSE